MSDDQTASEATIRRNEYLDALRKGEEQANRGEAISLEQLEKNLQTAIAKSLD